MGTGGWHRTPEGKRRDREASKRTDAVLGGLAKAWAESKKDYEKKQKEKAKQEAAKKKAQAAAAGKKPTKPTKKKGLFGL